MFVLSVFLVIFFTDALYSFLQFELDQQLCLFARDEVMTWLHTGKKSWTHDVTFRSHVATYSADFVKRVETLACKREREEVSTALVVPCKRKLMDDLLQALNLQNLQGGNVVPIFKTVTNLVSSATNPLSLANMSDTFMPWF